MSFCFLQKQRKEGKTGSFWGVGTGGRGEDVGIGCRRANMVPILCTHICKWKNEDWCNYSRNGGREDKGE
jgi:hypothetical protein